MIIRKPYAFLIKNFRLIHFFILFISLYIFFKSLDALSFFNEYVSTRQFVESATLINDTIPFLIILLSIFLIIACVSIAILFQRKDKPMIFYMSSIIYYVLFIIVCFISRGVVKTIIFDGIDPRIARIIRDVWLIAVILQMAVVGFSLIRALGFDVKKFNFGEDLQELQISDEDNEEVELTSGFDADKFKIRVAMQKEEFKSFFYQNRFMIILVLILLLVVIPGTLIAKSVIENKRYQIGETIDLKDFELKFTGAYVTKRDYRGNKLFKGKYSYLIVSFNINNLKKNERGITLNNLRLEVNNKIYMPKLNYYEYFTDIGIGYNNNKISKESKDYIVVYAISDDDLNSEMIIRYADKITVKNSQASALYYRTIIKPENIDVEKTMVNRTVGEDLIIEYKELKGTRLNISHYNLKDKFIYEVNGKTRYVINSVGLVLSLNYDFSSKAVSFTDFIEKNMSLKYKYNNNIYTQKINNITPTNYKPGEIYLAVSENLKDATEIYFVVSVRNTEYVYKMK